MKLGKKGVAFFSFWVCLCCLLPAVVQAEPDYDDMVSRIEGFFNKALTAYKAGDAKQAQLNAEAAYFQVFENMEGPIRVNISAKKNFILESEFSGIRKMMKNGEPYEATEERVRALLVDLRKVAAELKGGFVLKAEGTAGDEASTPAAGESKGTIDRTWQLDLDLIRMKLKVAVDAVKLDNRERAQEFVLQGYFDGYKSTLLEDAVSQYVSAEKGAQLGDGFVQIVGQIRGGESAATIEKQVASLLSDLQKTLVGLPLVRGAVGKAAPRLVTKDTIPDKDWPKIGAEMMAAVEEAMVTFQGGDHTGASRKIQSIYFDVFEETKLEISIGVLDQDLMLGMEGTFGEILRGMAEGQPEKDIRENIDSLGADLDRALELLAEAKK